MTSLRCDRSSYLHDRLAAAEARGDFDAVQHWKARLAAESVYDAEVSRERTNGEDR